MSIRSILGCAILFCISLTGSGQNIALDDSLAAHAEMYKVKTKPGGMGKVMKISFGGYNITSSKSGWTKTNTRANLLETKKQRTSSHKFSFVLSHSSGIAASVNAETYRLENWTEPMEMFPNFYVGEYKMILDSSNFTSYIMLHQDTANTWALFMILSGGSQTEYTRQAILTNGTREIFLMTVTSNRYGNDPRSLPATGYEFVEGDQAIGALQYYGGGLWGMNKFIVWLYQDLDTDTKLLLAAAMTAVMETNISIMME